MATHSCAAFCLGDGGDGNGDDDDVGSFGAACDTSSKKGSLCKTRAREGVSPASTRLMALYPGHWFIVRCIYSNRTVTLL